MTLDPATRHLVLFERSAAAKDLGAELSRLSLTDSLTGLANPRCFVELFDKEWQRARREDLPLSLLIVDADHFKRCNDVYGHLVGDEILQALAASFTASLQRPGDRACRIGGGEFAVILPDTDQTGARPVADQVHAMAAKLEVGRSGVKPGTITVSIGLACADFPVWSNAESTQLFGLADRALYDAKAGGRNQTKVADSQAQRDSLRQPLMRMAS